MRVGKDKTAKLVLIALGIIAAFGIALASNDTKPGHKYGYRVTIEPDDEYDQEYVATLVVFDLETEDSSHIHKLHLVAGDHNAMIIGDVATHTEVRFTAGVSGDEVRGYYEIRIESDQHVIAIHSADMHLEPATGTS